MSNPTEPLTEDELARLWALTPEREYIESIAGGYFAWAAGVAAAHYNTVEGSPS